MNKRKLGRTGLKVSEMGFGCWAIGGSGYGPTRDEESLDALDQAWERGVNFYDTADTYGFGHSEELVARFLKNKPRDQVVIASKVGWDFYHGGHKKNFDPEYIPFACEKSLKRLGIEIIDVYQLHNPKADLIRNRSLLDPLEKLKKEGKIRNIGISIHTEADALAAMDDDRVDTLQLVVNLIDQNLTGKVFEVARKKNIGLIVREPLACGLLTAKYSIDSKFDKEDHRRRWMPDQLARDIKKVEALKAMIPGDLSLTRAALEFVLSFEEVSTVIPGAKTRAQVYENLLAAEDPKLTGNLLEKFQSWYQESEGVKK